MAKFAFEVVGPAAANGWQTGGYDAPYASAPAAWHAVAGIAQRKDPELAAKLRERTAAGCVDHDGTRYSVLRTA